MRNNTQIFNYLFLRAKKLKPKDTEHGFTMIELLVVILIIGVLASIAIPAFMNQRKEASNTSLKSDIKNVALAVETWKVKGNLPQDTKAAPGHGGWTVVQRYDENAVFSGEYTAYHTTGELIPEVKPDGFPDIKLSQGVAVGIVTNAVNTGGSGYCIIGNVRGGTWDATKKVETGVSAYANALYYDSRGGGLYESHEIPTDSACSHYGNRIKNGV